MNSPAKSYPSIAAIGDNTDRVAALYSPFRAKNLNPEHYDEKQKFWVKAIEEYSTVDRRIVFSIKDLEQAFLVQPDRIAACLPDVVEHLRKTGTLICEDEYRVSLNSPSNWWSWTTKPIKFVASTVWNMSPLSYYTQKKITKETRLVFVPQLLSQATSIINNSSLQNQLMTLDDWKEKVSEIINPNEIDLLYEFLKVSGNIVTDKLGETVIVKLASNTKAVPLITAAEKGQFDIMRTKENLEKDLQVVFKKQKTAENLAKTALKDGQRTTAKYHLRTKKTLEKRADKLCALIDNLTVIAFQIEEAQTDAKILLAYETGKKALGKVLDENNITVDRANDVMLDMQEALEDQAEVSSILSRDVSDEDITSLEDELEQLLAAENQPSLPKEQANTSMDETLNILQNLNLDGLDELKLSPQSQKGGGPSPSQA